MVHANSVEQALFDKEEDLRKHDQKMTDLHKDAHDIVRNNMENDIDDKRTKAQEDSKTHVEQVVSSYRAMIQHQLQIAYDQRCAAIEEAYRQQKQLLQIKLNEIPKLSEKTYMEYMSKVEQDILVMIRTEIDLHVRQNFQEDLERQKSISADKEALTNSLRDINNQMSELKLKKETLIQKTTSGDTTESKINRLKILIEDSQRMKQKSIESLEFQLNHLEGEFTNMTLVKTDEEVVGADTAQIVKEI